MALPLSYPNFHTNVSASVVDRLVDTGVYIESTVPFFLHKTLKDVTAMVLTPPTSPGALTTEEWTTLNASFAKASERYLNKHVPEAAVSAVAWAKHLKMVLSELPHGHGYTPIIYAVGTTMTCVTACFVAARFWSKKKLMNHLRIEDWIILFCMLNGITYSTLMQKSVQLGGGTHIWDVTWNRQLFIMKCAFLCNFFYATAIASVKVALLCFYYRLSPLRSYRISVLAVICFVSALYISTVLTLAFSCRPIAYWTSPWHKKCINEKAFWMTTAIINMISDVITLLIPTPVVWKLQLRKREKVGIILLFGLGLFACFASTLRIMTLNGFFESTDFTYKEALTGLWGLVELDVAIICSCIPAAKALISYAFHRSSESNSIGELTSTAPFKDIEMSDSTTARTRTQTQTSSLAKKHESISTTTDEVSPALSEDGLSSNGRTNSSKRHSGVVHQMDVLEEARQRVQMFSNYVYNTQPGPPEPKYFDEKPSQPTSRSISPGIGVAVSRGGEEDFDEWDRRQAARERLQAASKQQKKVMPEEDVLSDDGRDDRRTNTNRESYWGSIGSAGTSGTGGVILTTQEFEERERKEGVKSENPRLEKFRFDFK